MSARVAIVGAGPAGCYLAQALLKGRPDLGVDVIDRLPVPYGLVRYGVAADHQGTKAVARQFARVFERQGARFFGNVEIGRDLTLDDLRAGYDAVVLATGLSRDRRLGIPGDNLAGVIGSGALTRALYEHPDAAPLPGLGPAPLVVGNGNVALDILRLLAKTPAELEGSDLGEGPTRWLAAGAPRNITVVGRSPAARARFDPVMLKEFARLAGVRIETDPLPDPETPGEEKLIEALGSLRGHGQGPAGIRFRFGLTPVEVVGPSGHVEAVRFRNSDAGEETIPATSVITAVGFEDGGGLPRDAARGGDLPGLYAAGWFGTGPRGTIPEARSGAQALAERILADLDAQAEVPSPRPEPLAGLAGTTDFDCWTRIDAAETAAPPPGRCRRKLATRAEMLAHAVATETEDSPT